MAATSKGYQLCWADAALIMAVVATALETTGHWNVKVLGPPLPPGGCLLRNPVALALHVRIAFGGMRSDQAFLGRLRDQMIAGTLPLWTGGPVWLEEDIPWLDTDEDILLEAVDQHVYPRLAEAIPGLQLDAVAAPLTCGPPTKSGRTRTGPGVVFPSHAPTGGPGCCRNRQRWQLFQLWTDG